MPPTLSSLISKNCQPLPTPPDLRALALLLDQIVYPGRGNYIDGVSMSVSDPPQPAD